MEWLDLNHLTVFAKIVESGNLTRAAKVLDLPKSRVSRILSQLEKDLGVQLIHRTTRNLQLTEIGRQFYERCKGPLAGLEDAARNLCMNSKEIQGRIRLTSAQDFASSLLVGPIDEFSRLYPKVQFDVLLSQEPLDLIRESIDLAIRIGPLKDSGLKAIKVAEVSLILVASPQFLEKWTSMNSIDDLTHTPTLGFEALKGRGWTFRNGREKRTFKIDCSMTTNNPDFNLRLCLRGRGIALLPDYLCQDHLKSGSLVHLFKSWKGESVPISLVYPYQKQMPAHIRRFADFLMARLKAALAT